MDGEHMDEDYRPSRLRRNRRWIAGVALLVFISTAVDFRLINAVMSRSLAAGLPFFSLVLSPLIWRVLDRPVVGSDRENASIVAG